MLALELVTVFEWSDIVLYMLADADIEYSKKLNHNNAIYIGAESGALFLFDNSRFKISANASSGIFDNKGRKQHYKWLYQFDINKEHALRLEADFKKQDDFREKEIIIKYVMYF